MKKTISTSLLMFLTSTSLAFAQTPITSCLTSINPGDPINNFCDFASLILGLLNAVIPILITLAIVFFIAGVAQYVINPSSSEERERGQQYMLWGIIGLFVIVSIWGLVSVLTGTFGISVLIPQLQP